MPNMTGFGTDPRVVNQSIADSLRTVGEGAFAPVDPLARERMRAEQRRGDARTKAADALNRGDAKEYIAQSIIANQDPDAAIKFAGASGINLIPTRAGNVNQAGETGFPQSRFVPLSPALATAPATSAQPSTSVTLPSSPAPQPATAPATAAAPSAPAPQLSPIASAFNALTPTTPSQLPAPRVTIFSAPRAQRQLGQPAGVSPF